MIEFVFTLPREGTLSSNDRPHWAVRKRKTKALREIGYWYGRQARRSLTRAHLTATVTWPALRRRRDAPNLWPTVKPLVDGLVDAGLLPDDDDTHLSGPDWRVSTDVAPPDTIIITLRFAPPQDIR